MVKSWQEKYDSRKGIEIKVLDKKFADINIGESMLISTPKIIEQYIRKIPKGKSVDIKKIREDLAKKYKADKTCPVTTGIFLRIVAELAHEQIENGASIETVSPFWRAINTKMPIAKKLSFDIDFIDHMREKEGIN